MVGVGKAKEQRDSYSLDIRVSQRLKREVYGVLIERRQYFTTLIEPFKYLDSPRTWHERRHLLDAQVVEFRTSLPANLQHIAKTLGSYQARFRSLVFEYGI